MDNPYPDFGGYPVKRSPGFFETLGDEDTIHEVSFNHTKWYCFPFYIRLLKNIKKIDCWDNRIYRIPSWLMTHQELEYIDLSFNRISTVPKEIFNLPALHTLLLRTNHSPVFKKAKDFISAENNLQVLDLRNNFYKQLPSEIRLFKNLKELHLGLCGLPELPEYIFELTELEWLDLSSNILTAISPEIKNLKNLKHLNIGSWFDVLNYYEAGNRIQKLSKEIGELSQLTFLDISSNPLKNIPEEIGNLTNLEVLIADEIDCEFPLEILKNFKKLKELCLCKVEINTAFIDLIASLQHLQELDLIDFFDEKGYEELKSIFPHLDIRW